MMMIDDDDRMMMLMRPICALMNISTLYAKREAITLDRFGGKA